MKHDIIIAIDPDTARSGVAVLRPATRQLETHSLAFPLLLEFLCNAKAMQLHCKSIIVVIEAGWKHRKSNFRAVYGTKGQRIAKNVGGNHETGKKLVEMCLHYGIEVVEHYPLKKCWKGRDGKITHAELAQFAPIPKQTNQEVRDAVLLAWSYANLPIKIKLRF